MLEAFMKVMVVCQLEWMKPKLDQDADVMTECCKKRKIKLDHHDSAPPPSPPQGNRERIKK